MTLDPAVRAALQGVLDSLPTIAVPATVATLKVTPGRKIEGGGRLTQHALDLTLTVGGQNVVDLTVGEATVGAAQVNCGGVADLALQCTSRPIVLIDVLRSKGRVKLLGAASRRFAGRRVKIRFMATARSWRARACAAPGCSRRRRSCRARGCAPPTARATAPRSPSRRACGSSSCGACSSRARPCSGGRVTIAGRVVRPLGAPVQRVIVKRRLSCGRYRVIKRFTPPASGRFRVTLGGPGSQQAAVVPAPDARAQVRQQPEAVPHVHAAEVRRPGAVATVRRPNAPHEDRRDHRTRLS